MGAVWRSTSSCNMPSQICHAVQNSVIDALNSLSKGKMSELTAASLQTPPNGGTSQGNEDPPVPRRQRPLKTGSRIALLERESDAAMANIKKLEKELADKDERLAELFSAPVHRVQDSSPPIHGLGDVHGRVQDHLCGGPAGDDVHPAARQGLCRQGAHACPVLQGSDHRDAGSRGEGRCQIAHRAGVRKAATGSHDCPHRRDPDDGNESTSTTSSSTSPNGWMTASKRPR